MLPVQITIRDFPASQALESQIHKRAEKLTHFCRNITSCRVVVEQPQKHKHQGKLFNVHIDVTVPRKEFAVTRKQDEDVYVALRDAFAAMKRQLEEHSRKINGHVKLHDGMMRGQVTQVFQEEGYGLIDGDDGNEYYFGMTNVGYPSFEQLSSGDQVYYIPQHLNDGRQAHRVVKKRQNNHNGNHSE
jgi:ribosomal subunit interface protein